MSTSVNNEMWVKLRFKNGETKHPGVAIPGGLVSPVSWREWLADQTRQSQLRKSKGINPRISSRAWGVSDPHLSITSARSLTEFSKTNTPDSIRRTTVAFR